MIPKKWEPMDRSCARNGMISKNGNRFSEKIMRKKFAADHFRNITSNQRGRILQRGRKRKAGATRYPSGQIKRESINLIPAATIRRMITVAQARAPTRSWRRGSASCCCTRRSPRRRPRPAASSPSWSAATSASPACRPASSAKSPNYERGFGESAGTDDPDADPEQVAKATAAATPTPTSLRAADPHGAIDRKVTRVSIDDSAPDW